MKFLILLLTLVILVALAWFVQSRKKEGKIPEVELSLERPIKSAGFTLTLNKIGFFYDVFYDNAEGVNSCFSAKLEEVLLYASFKMQGDLPEDWDWSQNFTMQVIGERNISYPGVILNIGYLKKQRSTEDFLVRKIQLVAECPDELNRSSKSLVINFNIEGQIYYYKLK